MSIFAFLEIAPHIRATFLSGTSSGNKQEIWWKRNRKDPL
jgi:hypothetical protein